MILDLLDPGETTFLSQLMAMVGIDGRLAPVECGNAIDELFELGLLEATTSQFLGVDIPAVHRPKTKDGPRSRPSSLADG